MPGPVDLPLTISQLVNVQKISNSEITKGQLQHSLLINPAVQEKNKDAQKQIQTIEKDEKSKAIQDENSKDNKQELSHRQKKNDEQAPEEEKQVKPSPWSGNIVNVKI